jgi:hypothetical protein
MSDKQVDSNPVVPVPARDGDPETRTIRVKVRNAPGAMLESLYAEQVGMNTVRIINIPLSDKVAFGDVVRLTPAGRVGEVLERSTRTRWARWAAAPTTKEAQRQFNRICEHFAGFNIVCEGMGIGWFGMAVPLDLNDERLAEICATCPVPLTRPPNDAGEQEAGASTALCDKDEDPTEDTNAK